MSKEFKTLNERVPRSVLVVDALNLAFRYKHNKTRDFAASYVETVNSLANSYRAEKVIIVADKGSSSYRLGLHPGYKSARREKYANETEAEKEESKLFFEDYEKTIELLDAKFTLIRFPQVEADDLAAYIVNAKDTFNISSITLVSSDKDWDLLIQPGVQRFSYVTRKTITVDTWDQYYSIPREMYLTYKCLTGDSGDSIPGVSQVGPARAVSLIKDYGDVFSIAEALPIPSKYAYMRNLNEFGADNLLLNAELMDLVSFCTDAIGETNLLVLREQLQECLA